MYRITAVHSLADDTHSICVECLDFGYDQMALNGSLNCNADMFKLKVHYLRLTFFSKKEGR